MTTKLTLSVEPEVVHGAKRYAARRKTSVSKLVQGYLRRISREDESQSSTPILDRLKGVLKDSGVVDPIEEYRAYLIEKHSK